MNIFAATFWLIVVCPRAASAMATVACPSLGDARVQTIYHYAIVEDVEPFKLHPTFMSYLYEVFEHLQLLCIDIWMHIHSITTTDVPQIWES